MSNGPGVPYWAWFGLATLLALGTVVLIVFAVFPARFPVSSVFPARSTPDFPTGMPDFGPSERSELVRPRPPVRGTPTPGPRAQLWVRLSALREADREEETLPIVRRWLDRNPEDHALRLEYARALEREGRLLEAEEQYARSVEATDDPQAKLDLARVRWRLGDRRGALALYESLEDDPDVGPAARRERAELLSASGRHREAVEAYRSLVAEEPGDPELRLALARALYAAGWLPAASREASVVPSGDPRASREAAALRARIRAELGLPSGGPATDTPAARARAAAARGDLTRAESLYRAALRLRPGDVELRMELAELLATRAGFPAEAARVLEADPRPTKTAERAELDRRAALYRSWAGDEEGALRILRGLAARGDATAADIALIGDLERWLGRPGAAAESYERALVRDPDLTRARAGLRELRAGTRRKVSARDPAGAGVESDLYVDSDDFRSWGVSGVATLGPGEGPHRLEVRSGVRSVRGRSRAGPLEEAIGPTGEAAWIAWWRRAAIRTVLRAGAEQIDPQGTSPTVGAAVEIPALGVRAGYRRNPAHPTTLSFASVQDETTLDGFRASVFRSPGGGPWNLWLSGEAASVRGGGVDNGRFVGQGFVDRAVGLGGTLRAGYATRALTTTDPAPITADGLSTYWSPSLSWSHAARLAVERPVDERGWGWRGAIQPGLAVIRLQGSLEENGTDLEFRFAGEGGLEYRGEAADVRLQASYLRTRADGFEAFAGTLQLLWRF